MNSSELHNEEIWVNLEKWKTKPLLQIIYDDFYKLLVENINKQLEGKIVELGSGIGNLKKNIDNCITTDLFPNPWIDQTENAYCLSFDDQSVSNLILFDVFHHLQYPGEALREFQRVLMPEGRVIIFDPAISVLGLLVYGIFHHEPISCFKEIQWTTEKNIDLKNTSYYAAQGNASRIFIYKKKKYAKYYINDWNLINMKRLSAISYVASGGYKQTQLYPTKWYHSIKKLDRFLDFMPVIFSTRMLIVLEKKNKSIENEYL